MLKSWDEDEGGHNNCLETRVVETRYYAVNNDEEQWMSDSICKGLGGGRMEWYVGIILAKSSREPSTSYSCRLETYFSVFDPLDHPSFSSFSSFDFSKPDG